MAAQANSETIGLHQVVSYNMHGLGQGVTMLNSLCYKYKSSLIFCQERWQTPDQLSNFNCFNNDYNVYSFSSMANILNKGILRSRPYGGLAILVNKNVCNMFNKITVVTCADRYMQWRN